MTYTIEENKGCWRTRKKMRTKKIVTWEEDENKGYLKETCEKKTITRYWHTRKKMITNKMITWKEDVDKDYFIGYLYFDHMERRW